MNAADSTLVKKLLPFIIPIHLLNLKRETDFRKIIGIY